MAAYSSGRCEVRPAVVEVPDPRVDVLSRMFNPRKTTRAKIQFNDISGRTTGIKFDRIELLDLDQDGDLDLLTCEERDNLGLIWYENPAN